MDSAREALVLFFAVFWSGALASISEYNAFDTADFFRSTERLRGIRRFAVAVTIANFVPVAVLYVLYKWVFADKPSSALGVVAAASASMSVFSIPRILHSIIVSPRWYDCFYTKEGRDEVVCRSGAKPEDSFGSHFWPGLAYLLIGPLIAWAIMAAI